MIKKQELPQGDVHRALEWYLLWKLSSFQVLPFAGGWLDQPRWVRENMLLLMQRDNELHAKSDKRRRGLPDDVEPADAEWVRWDNSSG